MSMYSPMARKWPERGEGPNALQAERPSGSFYPTGDQLFAPSERTRAPRRTRRRKPARPPARGVWLVASSDL
eukprot:15443009-Alexandrium_andersonii.AAC.1